MKRLGVRNQFKNKTTSWIELCSVNCLEQAIEDVKNLTQEFDLQFTLNIQETKQFIFITIVFL